MDDVAQRLGRTFRVDAAQGGFILEMDDRCTAGRTDCRHPVRLCVLRVMDDADDLRDDVAGFPATTRWLRGLLRRYAIRPCR